MRTGEYLNQIEFLSHFHMMHKCFTSICDELREKMCFQY